MVNVEFAKKIYNQHTCGVTSNSRIMNRFFTKLFECKLCPTVTKYTQAVHDGKKLFQYDICDYCCFQDIKTHKRHEEMKPQFFFSKHSLAVHDRKKLF